MVCCYHSRLLRNTRNVFCHNAAGVLDVNDWSGFGISYPAWGVVMLVVATVGELLTRFR